jgi:hypothetical protein
LATTATIKDHILSSLPVAGENYQWMPKEEYKKKNQDIYTVSRYLATRNLLAIKRKIITTSQWRSLLYQLTGPKSQIDTMHLFSQWNSSQKCVTRMQA